MAKSEIRIPKQQRAIEKKNKIIKAGFKLFCEKGFHNTNTAEIAKEAGVSTGIVYNYFSNKKEILIESLREFNYVISEPIFSAFKNVSIPINLKSVLCNIIDYLVENHVLTKAAHEEIQALFHSDEEIAEIYISYENEMSHKIVAYIKELGIDTPNLHEKIHIAYNMIENYCHEVAYYNHECIDYDVMKNVLVDTIIGMLAN